jgi:hypothetical protein
VLVLAAALVTALAVAGCGRSDFKNDPRPPVPAEVSVKIAKDGVAVSPKEFGAGLVNFTIANLTTRAGTLTIQGPVDADSDQIPPSSAETLRVDMKTGSYEAGVDGFGARPFSFTVGPERGSGQNDLLLP